jgi:hypothetical protein
MYFLFCFYVPRRIPPVFLLFLGNHGKHHGKPDISIFYTVYDGADNSIL